MIEKLKKHQFLKMSMQQMNTRICHKTHTVISFTVLKSLGIYGVFFKHPCVFKRDFKTKYKRTVLGMLWSVLSPLLTLLIMRLVFTHFFGMGIELVNYNISAAIAAKRDWFCKEFQNFFR